MLYSLRPASGHHFGRNTEPLDGVKSTWSEVGPEAATADAARIFICLDRNDGYLPLYEIHTSLLSAMRAVLHREGIPEVPASGEFYLSSLSTVMFPGAVYGFAARLSESERLALFEEAQKRGLSRLESVSSFKPIEDDLYPIYWGKDKQLGARPHQHLQNPVGTGAIRLSTYKSLSGKAIACTVLVVSDFVRAEFAIQRAFPDLLKTTTKKHIAT